MQKQNNREPTSFCSKIRRWKDGGEMLLPVRSTPFIVFRLHLRYLTPTAVISDDRILDYCLFN